MGPDGRHFKGEYKNDKKEGYGEYTWPDGRKYNGPWKNNKMHGIGHFIGADGKIRKGEWCDNKLVYWLQEGPEEKSKPKNIQE